MKALVLAAGFGKRLLPFTKSLPKPLFTIENIPLIDITISKLIEAGCDSIDVNTHHLADLVKDHIDNKNFSVPVNIINEETILETGGAIRNSLTDSDEDLLVINGDIVFDFDLKQIIHEHKKNNNIVTLLMHDHKEFNNVEVENSLVRKFRVNSEKALAFTGIHIVSSKIKEFIPDNRFISIIDVYIDLISKGFDINCIIENPYWKDIGTPDNYKTAVIENLFYEDIELTEIKGDGSDRKWYRTEGDLPYIISDHGINTDTKTREVESFVYIGKHLREKGVNVPEIYRYDYLSGLVSVEDLGSTHLVDYVAVNDDNETINIYEKIIKKLIDMSFKGVEDFNDELCWQTKAYDENLIIENECNYFLNEFVLEYCGIDKFKDSLLEEFKEISVYALKDHLPGFMHRDFQSKNIMIKDRKPYFIDFQGGRKGPIEYDLASLLIDPYVNLSGRVKKDLLGKFFELLKDLDGVDEKSSLKRYRYCRITRNLQMLGAFSFLTKKKHKVGFEKYIPLALKNLKNHLFDCDSDLKILKRCVDESIGKLNIKV